MALLGPEQLAIPQIQEGDAGLLMKADGTFTVFNCHTHIDPQNLTERQLQQGKALTVFATLLQAPHLMSVIENMIEGANLFTEESVIATPRN